MRRFALSLLAVSLLNLTACTAPGGRGGPEGGPPEGGMGGGSGGSAMVVSDLQERLQRTADQLKLTPTQLVLWDTYQERVGALMTDQLKLQPYRARQNAMQQIGQKVDTVRSRLAAMEDIQDAAAKLYATLDDKQKTTADQMLQQTVPALYSGLGGGGDGAGDRSGNNRGERNGRGGGMGGPGGMGGGGMGGGMGRL